MSRILSIRTGSSTLFGELNRKVYSLPLLARKALATFARTRNGMSTMFALSSNMNYRNVNRAIQKSAAAGSGLP